MQSTLCRKILNLHHGMGKHGEEEGEEKKSWLFMHQTNDCIKEFQLLQEI